MQGCGKVGVVDGGELDTVRYVLLDVYLADILVEAVLARYGLDPAKKMFGTLVRIGERA